MSGLGFADGLVVGICREPGMKVDFQRRMLMKSVRLRETVVVVLGSWHVGDGEGEQKVLAWEVPLVLFLKASADFQVRASTRRIILTDVSSRPGSPKLERQAMSSLPSGMTVPGAGLDGNDGIKAGVRI